MTYVARFLLDGAPVVCRLSGDSAEVLGGDDDLALALADPNRPAVATYPVSDLGWLPPLHPKARVLAVALNYRSHARETGNAAPARPLFFYKPPTSLVGQGGRLDLHESVTPQMDYEGEVGIVIGSTCVNASADEALDYVAGIVAINDGSARDRLKIPGADGFLLDWLASKALNGSGGIGPVIAVGDDVDASLRDRTLSVETRLNDEVVQQATIAELVHSVEELVVAASAIMTLEPGDVIATGTPQGVGASTGRFLQRGDRLTVAVGHLPDLVLHAGQPGDGQVELVDSAVTA